MHTDGGGTQFNLSEVGGNATAVAIGNAYYPDNRTLSANVSKLAVQIGVDVVANILKEFAPDSSGCCHGIRHHRLFATMDCDDRLRPCRRPYCSRETP